MDGSETNLQRNDELSPRTGKRGREDIPVPIAVPASPTLADALRRRQIRNRLGFVFSAVFVTVTFIVLSRWVRLADHIAAAPGATLSPEAARIVVPLAIVAIACAVVGLAYWVVATKLRRDVAETTVLRVAGPMSVQSMATTNAQLTVARNYFIIPAMMAERLRGLEWGMVDYTRHSRLVVRIEDGSGRVITNA